MQVWKRLTSIFLAVSLCCALLTGCGEDSAAEENALSLGVCLGTVPVSLDPIYAQESKDQAILAHLYENLMRQTVDANGNIAVTYGMAKSVEQEENFDGTVTFTFRLRSAEWSDGRDVEAEDFVYAWRRLADPASQSPFASLLSAISGYEEARATGDMSLLQVSAKNDSTLEVILDGSHDWFLSQVCTATATMPLRETVVLELKEAGLAAADDTAAARPWWAEPEKLVTNGPYEVTSYEKNITLNLAANTHYYEAIKGPEELSFHFAQSIQNAQTLYDEGALDFIWPLGEERLAELAQSEEWVPEPELSTYTVLYNCNSETFADAAIRQVMSLVIDRNAIAEVVDVTARPAEGLVPYGVPENEEGDFRTQGGAQLDNDPETYEERCRQARQILADAGYDSVAALGELTYLHDTGVANRRVAEELCRQWKEELHITVTPVEVTEQELWQALRGGEYTLAGANLTAISNDPECFLSRWTSSSADNVTRYENSAYDTLMSIITSAYDSTARMGCLHDAEVLLLGDYAMAPLYTKGTDWMIRDTLTGAFRDPRGWFCFTNVMQLPEDV